jgi:hypothetical protein
MNDSVGDQLAQLFRQYLRGDARHEAAELEKLPRRLGEPIAQASQWNITWANGANGTLDRSTMFGGFKDGRGEFFGQDWLDGRGVFVRFVFSEIAPTSFRFEQAFSTDGGKSWEVNWKATFTRP